MEIILWILVGYIIAIVSFVGVALIEEREKQIMEEKFRKEDIERLKMHKIKKSLDEIKKGIK